VKTIAARVARKLRRRRAPAQLADADALPAAAEPSARWQPSTREVLDRLPQLRGPRQRWLLQQLSFGRSIVSLADELDWPVGEVNDQLRGVAAQLGVVWSAAQDSPD
jgi:DNA-directed RNA polymerase specialized sigma24 family protein